MKKLQLPTTLPAPVKWGLYISAGYLGWRYVVKPLFGYLGITDSAAETAFKKQIKDLAGINTNDGSIKSNITDLQATEIANTLMEAMNQIGTAYPTMIKVLGGINGRGLQLVYSKFGVPKYFGTGRGDYFGDPLTLFQWFQRELTTIQLDDMRYLWVRSGMKF